MTKPYWLANKGSGNTSERMNSVSFGLGLVCGSYILSGGGTSSIYANEETSLFVASEAIYFAIELGVRAIVEVKSDVTIQQINKIEDKKEEVWDTETRVIVDSGYYIDNGVE